jgi:hypothetical protein
MCDPPGYRRHPTTDELLETVFSARSISRLYKKDQLPLRESLEMAVRRVEGWREMAISLRGREPGSRGTSAVGRSYPAAQ